MSDDVEVTVKLTAEAVRLLRENKWEGHHDALRDKVRAALLAQYPEERGYGRYSATHRMDGRRVVLWRDPSWSRWHWLYENGDSGVYSGKSSDTDWGAVVRDFTDIEKLSMEPPKYDEAKVAELIEAVREYAHATSSRITCAVEAFDVD